MCMGNMVPVIQLIWGSRKDRSGYIGEFEMADHINLMEAIGR